MGKTKIRVIIILISVILFGGAYFAVLATEENKRLAKNSARIHNPQLVLSSAEREI